MKSVFFSLLLLLTSASYAIPEMEGNMEQWEDTMLNYATDWQNFSGKSLEEIEVVNKEFQQILEKNPERPKLWIIAAHLSRQKITPIISRLKKLGMPREKRQENLEYVLTIDEVNKDFKKALELDNGQLSLNDHQYINTVITQTDIKVENFRRMIDLWNAGERFDTHESDPVVDFEYKAYSEILTAYIDGQRYDEGLSVLDEMSEKFPSMAAEVAEGRQRVRELKIHNQAKFEKKERKSSVTEFAEKPQSAKTDTKLQSAKSVESGTSLSRMHIYISIGVLAILIIGTVVWSRVRKPS